MTAKTVARGYVLISERTGRPSAVVSLADAQAMRRRWGGRIVSAKGLRYRMAQRTLRVVIDADVPELFQRPAHAA